MQDPFSDEPTEGHDDASPKEDVRYDPMKRVAKYQRWVLFALLANVIVNILFFSGVIGEDHPLQLPVNLFSIVVFFFSVYAIYRLAKEFLSIVAAIACALLMIIPFAGLITLLVINQKATKYLQKRGVHVGLLGANPNDI
ncbi:MAG: hypothetical protein GXP24_02945 [Planctomycetes bacterium]|nr:hypothetical protein [Planctomycetota bacterium]